MLISYSNEYEIDIIDKNSYLDQYKVNSVQKISGNKTIISCTLSAKYENTEFEIDDNVYEVSADYKVDVDLTIDTDELLTFMYYHQEYRELYPLDYQVTDIQVENVNAELSINDIIRYTNESLLDYYDKYALFMIQFKLK